MKKFISKAWFTGNNPLVYVVAEGLSKGVAYLSIPVFVNLLSKEDFGRLSLYWVSVPLTSMIIDLASRSYIKKTTIDHEKRALKAINAHLYLYLFNLLVLFSTYALIRFWRGRVFIDPVLDYMIIINAFFFVTIENHLSFFQIKGLPLRYGLVYVIRNTFPYVIAAVWFIYVSKTLSIFGASQALVYGGLSVWLLVKTFVYTPFRDVARLIKSSLRFSLPILPSLISSLSLIYMDRYLIYFFRSSQQVADYTIAYTVASLLSMLFIATGKWWQSFVFRQLKSKNKSLIVRRFRLYVLAILGFGLVLVVFNRELILLISNETYLAVSSAVPVLVFGMFFLFLYSSLINIPFYYGKTHFFILPAISAFLLNFILNILLIPRYGYQAAAYTTLLSYLVEFLIIYVICIKFFNFNIFSSQVK